YNVELSCENLAVGETLTGGNTTSGSTVGTSARGTSARVATLAHSIAANTSKTYELRLTNTAASGNTPRVHIYVNSGARSYVVGAVQADENYTVGTPGTADKAITVGAWAHRPSWKNYLNNNYAFPSETIGTIASFSSLGPRIDGGQKPDITAPGAATISLRATGVAAQDFFIIDNDGLNLNGSGPANYYLQQGTSMASPHA